MHVPAQNCPGRVAGVDLGFSEGGADPSSVSLKQGVLGYTPSSYGLRFIAHLMDF